MRRLVFLAVLALPVCSFVVESPAFGQVTDSEKQAARQLWTDGLDLQKDSKFAEALEKFQRAQKVIQAPTHLVHIAECQAALGKLVEAAESYRAAMRMDAGNNAAFKQAQEQAQAELRPLEPRIPKLKIDVTPKDALNLSIQIDGQPINAALADTPLPIDPGPHKVTAFAPGYTSDEKSITLRERDSKSLALTLTQTGVVYTNPENPPPYVPPSNVPPIPSRYDRPPPPPPESWRPPPPVTRPADRSFLFGVRGGADVPTGAFGKRNDGSDAPMSDIASTGGSFAVEGGFRFSRIYLGLFYEFAAFGRGDHFGTVVTSGQDIQSSARATQNVTGKLNSHYFGLDIGYISHPDGVGLYADIGLGYRIVPHTIRVEDSAVSANNFELTETFTGGELKLALGIYIKAGSWLRLIPKVTVGLGSFSSVNTSCTTNGIIDLDCARFQTGSQSIESSSHSFIFLGLGGYWDKEIR